MSKAFEAEVKTYPLTKVNLLIMEHIFGQEIDSNISLQQIIPYASQALYLEAIIIKMYHDKGFRIWLASMPEFDDKFSYCCLFYNNTTLGNSGAVQHKDRIEANSLMLSVCLAALKVLAIDFDYAKEMQEWDKIHTAKIREEMKNEQN